jgi:alpha-beta hydrolase superfamily lysophospholipase
VIRRLAAVALILVALAGCSRDSDVERAWLEKDVTFDSNGLTLHGTYRHLSGDSVGPAALLISESGQTDRNGDNNVAGPIGNMRQLAEFLSERGVATLRYDKIGTGVTGLGPFAGRPADIGSAMYTDGARAALRFLAGQAGVDGDRLSVYAVGEGTIHAMLLADDSSPGAPRIHSLGLLQPLPARYLDLITGRVRTNVEAAVRVGSETQQQADSVLAAWRAAVEQVRTTGTAPVDLPDGLSAIVNPGNVKAVVESDAIDPVDVATRIPAATPVLLTCSDSDGQAPCSQMQPLVSALGRTALQFVELSGVNHVLRDDPTDNVAGYASKGPLSPQLTAALDVFVGQ